MNVALVKEECFKVSGETLPQSPVTARGFSTTTAAVPQGLIARGAITETGGQADSSLAGLAC
jgi:hypothetical protein